MEELKNIKVALLGSGTVGTGVYKLIERQREELPHKVGAGLTVSKVLVRDKNKKREGIDPSVLTDQWEDIITDDEIQDRKSTRLNSSHIEESRMPSSA